jgi:hypothetical protein
MSNYKKKGFNWSGLIGFIITVVFIISIVVGIGWSSSGFTNWNVKTWYNNWKFNADGDEAEPGTDTPDMDTPNIGTSNSMELTPNEGNGISLLSTEIAVSDYSKYGISTDVESAYTITATVEPTNATNTKINWTMSWDKTALVLNYDGSYSDDTYYSCDWYYVESEESEYSTSYLAQFGITEADFISITPSSDTLTLAVACLQAFGCPITITATSADNNSISATCRVDYRERVNEVRVFDYTIDFSSKNSKTSWYGVYRGSGTLPCDISVSYEFNMFDPSDIYAGLDDMKLDNDISGYYDLVGKCSYADNRSYTKSESNLDYHYVSMQLITLTGDWETFANTYILKNNSSCTSDQQKYNLNQARKLIIDYVNNLRNSSYSNYYTPVATLTVNVVDNTTGKTYTQTGTIEIVNPENIPEYKVAVTSVNLSDSNLVL